MNSVLKYIRKLNSTRGFAPVFIVIAVTLLAIPITALLVQQRQDLQQRAENPENIDILINASYIINNYVSENKARFSLAIQLSSNNNPNRFEFYNAYPYFSSSNGYPFNFQTAYENIPYSMIGSSGYYAYHATLKSDETDALLAEKRGEGTIIITRDMNIGRIVLNVGSNTPTPTPRTTASAPTPTPIPRPAGSGYCGGETNNPNNPAPGETNPCPGNNTFDPPNSYPNHRYCQNKYGGTFANWYKCLAPTPTPTPNSINILNGTGVCQSNGGGGVSTSNPSPITPMCGGEAYDMARAQSFNGRYYCNKQYTDRFQCQNGFHDVPVTSNPNICNNSTWCPGSAANPTSAPGAPTPTPNVALYCPGATNTCETNTCASLNRSRTDNSPDLADQACRATNPFTGSAYGQYCCKKPATTPTPTGTVTPTSTPASTLTPTPAGTCSPCSSSTQCSFSNPNRSDYCGTGSLCIHTGNGSSCRNLSN